MPKYLTPQQIVDSEEYPFDEGMMKWALSQRKKTGLDRATRKIGRRLFINKELFDNWLESHKERGDDAKVDTTR